MKGLLQKLARNASRWAWRAELAKLATADQAIEDYAGARRYALVRGSQLALLEQLFIMKQEKITRLQQAYNNHSRPMMEDLRKENYIRNAEGLAQSISALAQWAESYRARGKVWAHSDGTVQGVPGDKGPDVPADENW